jgi:hypothetical protein
VTSNSYITLLGNNGFHALHGPNNDWWMGGGVFVEALPGEQPVGVIFTWTSNITGKRMCNDLPAIDANPCVFGNAGGAISGMHCHAKKPNPATPLTPDSMCQELIGQDSLSGTFHWNWGDVERGLGWEQKGRVGETEFTVTDILLIYYTQPTPTPTPTNCPGCPQTPQDPSPNSGGAAPKSGSNAKP